MRGTTAIRSLMADPDLAARARLVLPDGAAARATIHPSFLPRMPDHMRVDEEFGMFVADIRAAVKG